MDHTKSMRDLIQLTRVENFKYLMTKPPNKKKATKQNKNLKVIFVIS